MRLATIYRNHYIFPPMIKFDKNLFYYKLPPFLFAALIIFASTRPNLSPPSLGVTWTDKIYHFCEYFAFGILIFRAFIRVHSSPGRGLSYLLLFAAGLAFAALDERVQMHIPNRDCSIYDWIADALGYCSAGALVILYRLTAKRPRF
jgi:VanZ family protein